MICNFLAFCENPGAGGSDAAKKKFCFKLEALCKQFEDYCKAFADAVKAFETEFDIYNSVFDGKCLSVTIKFCKKGGGDKNVTISLRALKDKIDKLKAKKAKLKSKVKDAKDALKKATPWK